MSRTDKDRPYWVRQNDPSEARLAIHMHHTPMFYTAGWNSNRWGEIGVCDLDKPMTGEWSVDRKRNCYYRVTPPDHYAYDKCEREDRNLYYYAPVRMKERDLLGKAAKQYNTSGEVDDVDLPGYHHHMPFGGGWWD